MDSGLLSLKWNNHSSTFFHVLETIRRKELYSDVTIACDGKFFSVHKLVLSTCSEYFQQMFERTQCKHPIVVLKDINHKDLESLLNYMYIGEVNVIQTELSSLIKAAECLKVKGLAIPDEPPPHKRPSKRSIGSDRDDSLSSKRNRRSVSNSHPSPLQNSVAKEERESNETISAASNVAERTPVESSEKEKDARLDDQSSNHNYKEFETITVKTENEDSNSESYVENELPPVTKYEFDRSPVDNTINSSLEEENESSSYSSHLQPPQQQQQPSSEDSMSHLIPSTSRFHGESSSWGNEMEGLEEGDKERGEGGSYDPSSYLLDNPQAKAQMDSFYHGQPSINTTDSVSEITHQYMMREGSMWKCIYPECSYQAYNKGNLSKHIRKHTGERPYACYMCSYRSKESSNLYKHIKYKHIK